MADARTWREEAPVILLMLGGMLVLIVLLVVAGTVLRKRLFSQDADQTAPSFTLSDLRRLHRQGQLTDEEYERAKAQVIQSARKSLDQDESEAGDADDQASPPPGSGDER